MRHRLAGRHFNTTPSRRASLFRSLSISLLEHESISTTLAKAKELRRVVEPLITRAGKTDNIANRRFVFSKIRDKSLVGKLFTDLGPHFADRSGGYLRILKTGWRKGDHAPMARIFLVGRPKDLIYQPDESASAKTDN